MRMQCQELLPKLITKKEKWQWAKVGGASWSGGTLTCSNRPLLKTFFSTNRQSQSNQHTQKNKNGRKVSGPQDAIYVGKLPLTFLLLPLCPYPTPENTSEGDPSGSLCSAGKPIEKCLFAAASGIRSKSEQQLVPLSFSKVREPEAQLGPRAMTIAYWQIIQLLAHIAAIVWHHRVRPTPTTSKKGEGNTKDNRSTGSSE